jgi:hypothetical protein
MKIFTDIFKVSGSEISYTIVINSTSKCAKTHLYASLNLKKNFRGYTPGTPLKGERGREGEGEWVKGLRKGGEKEGQRKRGGEWMGWDGMGWDGMGWDGMGWDGIVDRGN